MRYNISRLWNMRDLGGFPAENNSYTKFGRFLRSDAPLFLSDEDIIKIKELNITTVVDLRGEDEVLKSPCAFKKIDGMQYYNYEVGNVGKTILTEDKISENYFKMLDNKKAFYDVFTAFSNASGSVLFHCTAGKDRTGVTAALVLLLCGVAEVDVIANYQVSHTYIRRVIKEYINSVPNMPRFLGNSKPEYIAGFLQRFYDEYKTSEKYLLSTGLTQSQLQKIKDKLLK